ncbi:MAG: bifunctional phosphopantothenoylcysteine decarboxylase/phosphopantothenate--cysteine ligase CoaBC [SAR202 cluster bacterium]|nr:bifunctional phosphopantothenoylcysteine decarboxylase/phosphopantothenate--cysteine ligase CoaBC [SAR202 cluster bacterium]
MIPVLHNKHVVLGVTGSIACYKALDLASKLTQAGALVDVIMTTSAREFVTPLAFRSITHRYIHTDLFDPDSELAVEHVALAHRADAIVVAPATANLIAKLAHGLADDALTTTLLATNAPVIVAPAMDGGMYQNAATQSNLTTLKERGVVIVGPAQGRLASGLTGVGRLVETPELMGHIRAALGRKGDFAGKTVVVSAGGTQEPVDPVRILTNLSSGKMGYALAEAARDRGARVILVTTPVSLSAPVAVDVVKVRTAVEMRDAVAKAAKTANALIMAAAVADYRPAKAAEQKIKKEKGDGLTLELVKNPDILSEVKGSFVKVGFAAESQDLLKNAKKKLADKGLDLIVANDITAPSSGFGADTNKVLLLDKSGAVEDLPLMSKDAVADTVLDRVRAFL